MSWDFENRLELARRMRYPCGAHDDSPDHPGLWFTKPVKNPAGMGIGARLNAWEGDDSRGWRHRLDDGFMWMPAFAGEHFSVDFERVRSDEWRQRVTVRCEYDVRAARPARWCREARAFDVPEPLRRVDAEWLNVEFIGGRVIEAHARRNTDFDGAPREAREARVVWADQCGLAGLVNDFDDADGQLAVPRLGFMYR